MLQRFWSVFVSRDLEGRDYVIDVFRGIAVIGMILVNHPIPLRPVFAPLVHAPWHGWTFADTIYPAFLFVVGVAVALTTVKRLDGADRVPAIYHWRIVRRVVLLFALSFLIANFPYYDPRALSLNNLLAQIGWCYLALAYLALHLSSRALAVLLLALLLGQWGLYGLVDVPGYGVGDLTPEGNAQRYVEHLLFGSFVPYLSMSDVSIAGIVFTSATITTGLTGLLAGRWLRTVGDPAARSAGLFAAGCVLAPVGLLWGTVLPINKALWTSSFVVLTTGLSLQALAVLFWIVDKLGHRAWTRPLHIAGVNALVFYVLAWSLQRIVGYGRFTAADGSTVLFRHFLRDHWPAGKVGSFGFSLLFMALCFSLIAFFYRKRWYFKL
jgi:predicted acyltransferase